jgi:hypothetical protein
LANEPSNTIEDRNRPRSLYRGTKESYSPRRLRAVASLPVWLSVKQSESRMAEIDTSGSMSGDGERSDAERPKLPRPSSTLPY